MNRLIIIFLLSLTASISVTAQSNGSGTTLIKTDAGVLWVENDEKARFILEIKGVDIRPMQQYPFLSIDGRPMQVHLVGIEKFHKAAGNTQANDLLILQPIDMQALQESIRKTGKASLSNESKK